MLDQHLALAALLDAVQRGRQHQLGAGQEQAEENLVGQRGAREATGAQAETHGRGVGGDQAQSAPARHEPVLLGALDEPIVERRDSGQGQLGARLRERLLGHRTQ